MKKYVSNLAILALLLCMVLITDQLTRRLSLRQAENLICLQLIDVINNIERIEADNKHIFELYEKAALESAKVLAFIIRENPTILKNPQKMHSLFLTLNVDEYNIINKDGIIEYSSVPSLHGFDMASTPQSREFMPAISNPDFEYIQQPRPRGVDGLYFQYIGVSRKDCPGIVQIGYTLQRYQSVFDFKNLNRFVTGQRIGSNGYIVFLQNATIVASEDPVLTGRSLTDLGIDNLHEHGLSFTYTHREQAYLAMMEPYGDYMVMGVLPLEEVYALSNTVVIVLCLFAMSILFAFFYLRC